MDEAILHFQTTLEIQPDFPNAHNKLGNALLQRGRTAEAIIQYQTSLKTQPQDAEALNNLAVLLATARRLRCAMARRRSNWPNRQIT